MISRGERGILGLPRRVLLRVRSEVRKLVQHGSRRSDESLDDTLSQIDLFDRSRDFDEALCRAVLTRVQLDFRLARASSDGNVAPADAENASYLRGWNFHVYRVRFGRHARNDWLVVRADV